MNKYDSRGDLNEKVKIDCPKHKTQRTYDLINKGKVVGVGCEKCFKGLPEEGLTYKRSL